MTLLGLKKRAIWKINKTLSVAIFRKKRIELFRKKLINEKFSLISCNCIGGVIYHDLNHEFLSPTINLFMSARDFVKFAESLEYYLELELQPIMSDRQYPMAELGDLKLYLVHYKDFDSARAKWDERCKRINYSNLFFIFTDRDDFSEDLLVRIDSIPFKKILFSHKKYEIYDWCCYMPEFKNNTEVDDLTRYANCFGVRNYEKHFDFIKWLNGHETKDCIF